MFLRAYHSSVIVNEWPGCAESLGDAGERRVGDLDPRWLLVAVDDELAADHLDVRVLGTLCSAGWPKWPKVSVAQCMPMKPLPPRIAS